MIIVAKRTTAISIANIGNKEILGPVILQLSQRQTFCFWILWSFCLDLRLTTAIYVFYWCEMRNHPTAPPTQGSRLCWQSLLRSQSELWISTRKNRLGSMYWALAFAMNILHTWIWNGFIFCNVLCWTKRRNQRMFIRTLARKNTSVDLLLDF